MRNSGSAEKVDSPGKINIMIFMETKKDRSASIRGLFFSVFNGNNNWVVHTAQ
jgi:hypothetical protein